MSIQRIGVPVGLCLVAIAASPPAWSQTTHPQSSQLQIIARDQTYSAPTPGTVETSASVLWSSPDKPVSDSLDTASDPQLSQVQTPRQPRVTRGRSPNYIGVGGNVGIDGDTTLGDDVSFVVNGKIGLSPNFSLRPAVLIGDDATFIVPVTYDFGFLQPETFLNNTFFSPFAGGGLLITTEDDDNNFGGVLLAGLDVPLSRQFTANASFNLGFLEDDVELGFIFGLAYNFPDF